MRIRKILRIALAAGALSLAGPMAANAFAIHQINMEVRTSTYVVNGTETATQLLDQFNNNGTLVCNVGLAEIDRVGSVQTCGGPARNIATNITIDLGHDTVTDWQLGADWGRGGVLYAENYRLVPGDTWWAYNWNNPQVISFRTSGSGRLGLLGFEGCCGGGMSLRYSTDNRQTWNIAAVPEPGTLALLGMSLAAVGFGVRRKRA